MSSKIAQSMLHIVSAIALLVIFGLVAYSQAEDLLSEESWNKVKDLSKIDWGKIGREQMKAAPKDIALELPREDVLAYLSSKQGGIADLNSNEKLMVSGLVRWQIGDIEPFIKPDTEVRLLHGNVLMVENLPEDWQPKLDFPINANPHGQAILIQDMNHGIWIETRGPENDPIRSLNIYYIDRNGEAKGGQSQFLRPEVGRIYLIPPRYGLKCG